MKALLLLFALLIPTCVKATNVTCVNMEKAIKQNDSYTYVNVANILYHGGIGYAGLTHKGASIIMRNCDMQLGHSELSIWLESRWRVADTQTVRDLLVYWYARKQYNEMLDHIRSGRVDGDIIYLTARYHYFLLLLDGTARYKGIVELPLTMLPNGDTNEPSSNRPSLYRWHEVLPSNHHTELRSASPVGAETHSR